MNHGDAIFIGVEIIGVGVTILIAVQAASRRHENRMTKVETLVKVICGKLKIGNPDRD